MNNIPKQIILENARHFIEIAERTLPYYQEFDLFQLISYYESAKKRIQEEIKDNKRFSKENYNNNLIILEEELEILEKALTLCIKRTTDFGVILEYDEQNNIVKSRTSDFSLWYELWEQYIKEIGDEELEYIAYCKKSAQNTIAFHPPITLEQKRKEIEKEKPLQKRNIYTFTTRKIM